MINNKKQVIPYRIKQGRVSRGLSMMDLAELASVSKQAISQYELGKNEPSKMVLNTIANILKYPISFFYKPLLTNTNARIRFDIAHELGHLLMHADYYSEEDFANSVIHEKLENEANRFAGAFLLPKETFSNDVFSTSIDHFIHLKTKWKASIASMIYRCDTLGILSSNQIKYLKNQMTAKGYWKREPFDTEMPLEKPFAHKQAILLLLENHIVTSNQLVEDIGCFAEELEEYCFLDKGTLSYKKDAKIIELRH